MVNGNTDIRHHNADGVNLRPNMIQGVSMCHPNKGQPLSGAEGANRGRYWLNPAAFMSYDEMFDNYQYTLGNSSRTLSGALGQVRSGSA